jgi:HEAT repeat protein
MAARVREPANLAPKASAWASSEYSATWAAGYAIDEKMPVVGSRNDRQKAWAINRAKAGDSAEFTLEWPQPVDVATIVYWGRTGSVISECWRDYELYLDDAPKAVVTGSFKMSRGPQRIDIKPRKVRRMGFKFLNSYGPHNPGASEIAVYPGRPGDLQLEAFPLSGAELRAKIEEDRRARTDLAKVAATIPGKVVFLEGTRPWNHLDHQQPARGNYATMENHTHRCYIEKDTPGPANAGHRLLQLDPAEPGGQPRMLVDAGDGWIGCAMSCSFDGHTLYFCMAPERDPFFHIYSVPVTGGKPTQLTTGPFQDCDPELLPDGRIVFSSTRFGSREEYHAFEVSTLFTMNSDGTCIRPLTFHVVNDREPKVTADGNIVFVRQDNFFMNAKIATQIFHVDPFGRGQFMLLGQERGASGYNRYTMHDIYPQAIGFLAPHRISYKRNGSAFGNPVPLPDSRVAALCGPNGPRPASHPLSKHGVGIVISDAGAPTTDGLPVATSRPLHDISALPDGRLLCSTLDRDALGVVDLDTGTVSLFHMSRKDIQAPLYVGPRDTPPAKPIAGEKRDTGRETGFFFCQSIFNTRQIHADARCIRAVRVYEGRPLTARFLTSTAYHGGVNHIGTEAVELGTIPVCPDGSFFVEVPADRALAFEAIDGEGRAVINEFTWIYVRPGEERSCTGCHAARGLAPPAAGSMAMRLPPVRLVGEGVPFRYKANSVTHGRGAGVLGDQMDRIRETKSINLYPHPYPLSSGDSRPFAPGRAETTRVLIERLRADRAYERASTAQRLAVVRDRAAVPALTSAMADSAAAVRMNAALALAACGNRRAVGALLPHVQDRDTQVALAANMALSHLTAHEEKLNGISDTHFRDCADRWRRWLADTPWPAIEQKRIGELDSDDPQTVIMAAQSLGHVGGTAARIALRGYTRRCLTPTDITDLRSLTDAMRSLGYLGDGEAVALLGDVLKAHIPLPNGERSAKLAGAAAEALGWIGTPEAARVLVERSRELRPFHDYNLAVGDQGGQWGDYLSYSPVHYRFLEAFDALGTRLPEPVVWSFIMSLHLSFDQPLLQERDTYETMLARVVQRSGCLDTVLDTCFAMIGVGKGPLNETFRGMLVSQVTAQRYPQMHGTKTAFTIPQRVGYILFVLGMRGRDAPRYREAFDIHRNRYFKIRKDHRGLETGACAWICYYALETLGQIGDPDGFTLLLDALNDPPEAVDGFDTACNPLSLMATTPHYRVAAASGLGRLGRREAVPSLLETVGNFDNALEVRHAAAQALVRLCGDRDREALREVADDYPEVHTRRLLLEGLRESPRQHPGKGSGAVRH